MWLVIMPITVVVYDGIIYKYNITGWWFQPTPEKYEFVSWDDDIPNIGKVIKFTFQTTNQNMSSNKKNTTSKTDVVKVGRVPSAAR